MVDYDQDLHLPKRRYTKRLMTNGPKFGRRGKDSFLINKQPGSIERGKETRAERAKALDYLAKAKQMMARFRTKDAIDLYNKALNTMGLNLEERQRASNDLRILGAE